jgi:hypothetical protein
MKTYLGFARARARALGRSPLVASVFSCVVACSSDGGDKSTSASAAGSGGPEFSQCQKELKKLCSYDERETPCAALTTPVIPLSDGKTWGDLEVRQGPYGSIVDWNQGADFKNPINASENICSFAAAAFGEPQSVTDDVLDLRGQDLALYTVFRPACMKDGEKFPVITWGNGTCGQSGGYATLLASVASHGSVVVAANSRWTDAGNNEMLKALDFAEAANEDKGSPLYGRLDLDKVGAMGHSQGASATGKAADDPRVKAIILWNGGSSSNAKPFLAVSGERDITMFTPMSMATAVDAASQPGAWLFYHQVLVTGGNVTGHLTLMEQPERVIDATVAWWKYILSDDMEAKKMFVGDDCGLCNSKDEFEFGQHGLE